MRYQYSAVDNSNLKWFANDNTVQSLVGITLQEGNLRGLFPSKIEFKYPFSVIAGHNGSGKSTLLAIASCAFHNLKNGFKPDDRKLSYYTFSDFFIQTKDELSPDGIKIYFHIRHNNWSTLEPGIGVQSRRKIKGGKWNDYASRVRRNVIHFGTLRVVPPNELKTYKSYCRQFSRSVLDESLSKEICEIAGRIIGKSYDDFHIYQHTKFAMAAVTLNNVRYTGFNMGAGEKAVFSILYSLFRAGTGCLLVIDEIELGLHAKAQKQLIHELKLLCKNLRCQIICSTHSSIILENIPPEGRFYIERIGDSTKIIEGISSEYASGKLSGGNSNELSVFVEDNMAKSIIGFILPLDIRSRLEVFNIGSDQAVLRQVAARYREKKSDFVAILDGDKSTNKVGDIGKVKAYLEGRTPSEQEVFENDLSSRLQYLPGVSWPEIELISELLKNDAYFESLSKQWDTAPEVIQDKILTASRSKKHDEFYTLSKELELPQESIISDVVRVINNINVEYFKALKESIIALIK